MVQTVPQQLGVSARQVGDTTPQRPSHHIASPDGAHRADQLLWGEIGSQIGVQQAHGPGERIQWELVGRFLREANWRRQDQPENPIRILQGVPRQEVTAKGVLYQAYFVETLM